MLEKVAAIVALASTFVANLSEAYASSVSRSTATGAPTSSTFSTIALCAALLVSTVTLAMFCRAKTALALAQF